MADEFYVAERMAYAAFGSAVAIISTPLINTICFAAVTVLFITVGLIRQHLRHRT